jgi:predicted lipid-binding transport protein (Tim44 family)
MSTLSHAQKSSRLALAVIAVFALTAPIAEARVGGGISTGSRGLKTYTPPPSTKTAPGAAQGVQRSAQPAPQAARPAAGAASAAAAARPASRFGGGFMGGLLGAGLIGGLLGYGFFGGMSGMLGVLGFMLQFALIAGLAYMGLAWWRGRNQPALAAQANNANAYRQASMNDDQRSTPAGSMAGASGTAAGTGPLKIEDSDYASFERLLSVAQLSFSRGDVAALRSATTPEMLGYFTDQLEDNAKRGVRNEVADPKLVSGDLAESWTEGTGEYATVAMRYSLLDVTIEEASGKVVAGSKTVPQDVTEIWTFTRRHGGSPNSWRLSAIQQVS